MPAWDNLCDTKIIHDFVQSFLYLLKHLKQRMKTYLIKICSNKFCEIIAIRNKWNIPRYEIFEHNTNFNKINLTNVFKGMFLMDSYFSSTIFLTVNISLSNWSNNSFFALFMCILISSHSIYFHSEKSILLVKIWLQSVCENTRSSSNMLW